jgi:hypothetical protein
MIRCWQCGRSFPEEKIIRQDVVVGRTSGAFFGRTFPQSFLVQRTERVDLCLECFEKRQEAASAPVRSVPNSGRIKGRKNGPGILETGHFQTQGGPPQVSFGQKLTG